tara:strand:- start:688 stop:1125 length:438 start_codon:yes stop_codon:yes gene_type:complete
MAKDLTAPNIYFRNYKEPLDLLKGFQGGIVSTDKKMAPIFGTSLIVNTSFEKIDDVKTGYAAGMIGVLMDHSTPVKALEVFGPDHKQWVFAVQWKTIIVKIPNDYKALQGGEISFIHRHKIASDIISASTGIAVKILNDLDEGDS